MLKASAGLLIVFAFAAIVYPQAIELPHQYKTAETVHLGYPVNALDARAIGMGNAQIANGKQFNAMMYNPASLATSRFSIELLGVQANMSTATYDAANYISQHIDEFEQAISLNQIWDGLDILKQSTSTNAQRLEALHDIQDGLVFVDDLFRNVTGPSDNPETHGISFLPKMSAQFGNLGFSLYGFGQAGFIFQLSPTFESLLDVQMPATLENPLETARAAIQLTTALAPALVGPRKFADNVFPAAFYSSYFDLVAAAGYGLPITHNFALGVNLKIINRRFLLDRISVQDYDDIISQTWEKFQSDVTGVTADLGARYQFKFGTSIGATLQNIFPIQEIHKSIDTEFRFNKIQKYDISQNGRIDSLQYITWETTLTRPFALKVPFLVSLGLCHPLTDNWDVAMDWVDLAENDSRYEKTVDRLRLGTEYRFGILKNNLVITPRIGMADQRLSFGLGVKFLKFIKIDGAYAYNNFINQHTYYVQVILGW